MKVQKVSVSSWQELGHYLYSNQELLIKTIHKMKKKASNRFLMGIIFGGWASYKIGQLSNQVIELHRQIQKINERLDDQEDTIVNHLTE